MKHLNRTIALGAALALFTTLTPARADGVAYVNKGLVGVGRIPASQKDKFGETSDDYFLFVANDNDFLTQDGFQVGAPYKADGGADVDTTFLVYRVTLPGLSASTVAAQ